MKAIKNLAWIVCMSSSLLLADTQDMQEIRGHCPESSHILKKIVKQLDDICDSIKELQESQNNLIQSTEIIENDVSANFSNITVIRNKVCTIFSKLDTQILEKELQIESKNDACCLVLNSKMELLINMVQELLP